MKRMSNYRAEQYCQITEHNSETVVIVLNLKNLTTLGVVVL